MPKHIAMFPLVGKGHLYPTIGLCSLLVGRGYKVTCVIDEHAAAKVAEVGAEPICFRSSLRVRHPEEIYGLPHDPRWWEFLASTRYPDLLTLATDTLSQISGRYSDDVPDLVIYDRLAFAGRIFASNVGVAAVQIFAHFAYFNDCIHRERGICVNPPPMLRFADRLDSYLWERGIRTERNLWHNEALNIHFIPTSFQHHVEYFDERFCFVGACLNRPYKPSWAPPLLGEKPVVLISDISVGTRSREFFSLFVDALGGLDYHVVLSSGDPELRFDSLPENFEINRFASHLEILPHASLAISHAGAGTTLEALYHGVPVLVSPTIPPAAEIAYRVCELGVGASFPRNELTVDVIRWAVDGLIKDPDVRRSVLRARDSFTKSGGATLAADRIESLL